MRTKRFCFLVFAAAILAASCDPSAFGPAGADPRNLAVAFPKVKAELERAGYVMSVPAPFAIAPASVAQAAGTGAVVLAGPPEDILPVSARPSRFATLSSNMLLKSGEIAGLFGSESAKAESILAKAGVTDVIMSFTGLSMKDPGQEFYSRKEALEALPDHYVKSLLKAADSADGSTFLVGGVVECRGASYRFFYGNASTFRAAKDEIRTLFGADNDFDRVGWRDATLSVIHKKPLVVAVRKLYGQGIDGSLVTGASIPAYTIRMEGIDDYGYAFVNDQEILSGVEDDSGETPITAYLKPGENSVVFQVMNSQGELAYRLSVTASGRGNDWAWKKACGEKGVKGCSRQKGMFEERCVLVCDDAMHCRVK